MIRIKKLHKLLLVLEIYFETHDVILKTVLQTKHLAGRIYTYAPLDIKNGYSLSRSKPTSRIVLSGKKPEEVLATFKKNYRNEIRKTFRTEGFSFTSIKEFSPEGYALYADFEKKAERKPITASNAEGQWFLAHYEGKLIAGIYALPATPVLKIIAIFSERYDVGVEMKKMVGYASKRIVYEMVAWGCEQQMDFVDMAYVNHTDPSKAGITAFKLGFGGEEVTEYLYEKEGRFVACLRALRRTLG